PNHGHRGLLCPCHQWPRRSAAEQSDEGAPVIHSITSSARASRVAGTLRAEGAALALALQLALELVEEAPVSSLREDLGGTRLDDARLAETQSTCPRRPCRPSGELPAPAGSHRGR